MEEMLRGRNAILVASERARKFAGEAALEVENLARALHLTTHDEKSTKGVGRHLTALAEQIDSAISALTPDYLIQELSNSLGEDNLAPTDRDSTLEILESIASASVRHLERRISKLESEILSLKNYITYLNQQIQYTERPMGPPHLDLEVARLGIVDADAESNAMWRRGNGYRIVPRPFEVLWMDDKHLRYSQAVDAALPHGVHVTWVRNLREARFQLGHHIDGAVADLHLSDEDVRRSNPTGLFLFELMKHEGLRIPTAVCSLDVKPHHRRLAEQLGAIAIHKLDPMGDDKERAAFLLETFQPLKTMADKPSWTTRDNDQLATLLAQWSKVREYADVVLRNRIDAYLQVAKAKSTGVNGYLAHQELESLWSKLGEHSNDIIFSGLRRAILPIIVKSKSFDPGSYMFDEDIVTPDIMTAKLKSAWTDE